MLAQLLLASFDEEVGDVEDALLEFLGQQGQELGASGLVVGVAASDDVAHQLKGLHLAGEEPRGRKFRDEAAARMASEIHVGIAVLGIGDVPDPAPQGELDVLRQSSPLGLGDPEGRTDVTDPARHHVRHALVEDARQLVAQGTPRAWEAQERASPHVAFDALEILVESVVVPFCTHGM